MQLHLSKYEQKVLSGELEKLRAELAGNRERMAARGLPGETCEEEDGALLFMAVQEMIRETRRINRNLEEWTEGDRQDVDRENICTTGQCRP